MRRISAILSLIVLSTLTIPVLRAASTSDSYSFLDIATSTHAYALGGSGAAVIDDDVTLVDQNPALLGPEIDKQVAVNYMHYLGSSNFGGVRFGMAAGEHSAWAAGIRYLNFGNITRYELDGTESGSFSPQDVVFEATYSRDINDRFRGGINLKGIYSSYEQYNAFAMGVDLGLNYYYDEYDLSLSLVVRNLGGQLKKFEDERARLPINLEIAYMQALGTSPFSLAITATDLTHWRLPFYSHELNDTSLQQTEKQGFGHDLMRHIIFGLQYDPTEHFYAAIGYNYRTRTDMTTYHRNFLSGWSIGAGLKVRNFGIGLAFAQPHASGATLMLNLSAALSSL